MSAWVRACDADALAPGESIVVWDGDTPILVVNLDGRFFAVEDKCTHEDYELSAAPVDAASGELVCLRHAARFDARTGAVRCGPAHLPLVTFPVKLEADAVWTRDDR
jgi:3-phenylpropionate/trans-cinnamate dioxygenase ferredoxin subunit